MSELSTIKDIFHLISQCPAYENARSNVYRDLTLICIEVIDAIEKKTADVFMRLLGGQIEGIEYEQMSKFRILAGKAIDAMYLDVHVTNSR